MIRRSGERTSIVKTMFGGPGEMEAKQILNDGEFADKGRLFNHVTLKPGAAIGKHQHNNEFEVYYILSGHGTYDDNGTPVEVGPGDVTCCPHGERHGILNTGTGDLVFIALILFDKKS